MNSEIVNKDLESEVELVQMLHRFVQAVRCSRKKLKLAAVAARWEGQFKKELEHLEAEQRSSGGGDHQQKAA